MIESSMLEFKINESMIKVHERMVQIIETMIEIIDLMSFLLVLWEHFWGVCSVCLCV